jgi:hypothetical protein
MVLPIKPFKRKGSGRQLKIAELKKDKPSCKFGFFIERR